MATPQTGRCTLVPSLAALLRNDGDLVLDGSSTLTLEVGSLQQLTRLFERHLLSRTQQHGFLALPSHPADTSSLLQLQFLFDVLQKTLSLKLIQPLGSRGHVSGVKIFPFKSLRNLELKRVPPHALEGLRGVYSQLEVFICSRSLSSMEELLSLCGGDLSSALPWPELHTLDFSYNSIRCLDHSLSLLNALKSLDLSHNLIQDCGDFLLPLSELQHCNLGYNRLQRPPLLSLSSRSKLLSLVLRNNHLESINGLEQLCSLQHLDLSFNLLLDHCQLAPLILLQHLHTLNLEGNPLFYQKSHRTLTAAHLCPRTGCLLQLKLNGCPLSSSELAALHKPGQLIGPVPAAVPVAMVLEQSYQEVSSGGAELSDSLTAGPVIATRTRRKKVRGRVKVRRASISEPSTDTDHQPRTEASNSSQAVAMLPHQGEIERMDSFREQLGEEWLKYQHHLEGPPSSTDHTHLPGPFQTSEPREEAGPEEVGPEEAEPEEAELETESTLQWMGPSEEESTLEASLTQLVSEVADIGPYADTVEEEEGEEEELGVDLCLPLLVAVVGEDEEEEQKTTVFLRVKHAVLLELDAIRGHERTRLELNALTGVIATETTWEAGGEVRVLPAVKLTFSYVSRERRWRQYLLLDPEPQEALQALIEVLRRVTEENEQRNTEGLPSGTRTQCLRCQSEFSIQGEEEEPGSGNTRACPQCGSDHVVQLTGQSAVSTSTPLCHSAEEEEEEDDDALCDLSDTPQDGCSSSFSAQESSFCVGHEEADSGALQAFYNSLKDQSPTEMLAGQLHLQGDEVKHDEEMQVVDHRLKLFLHMEVFEEEEEELHTLLKMSVVRLGELAELPSLLVVSSQRFYFLEMTSSQSHSQPSDWLQKRASHPIRELSSLEVGLGSQTVHMEFEEWGVAYTLVVRDSVQCKRFFSLLTGIVRDIASKSDSKLKSISTSRLHPQHHLWPLVCEDIQTDVEDGQLQFHYLLASLMGEDSVTPVSFLATRETLYLLSEDHQWSKSVANPSSNGSADPCSGRVTVLETQPISCVSSVRLWSSDPCRLDILLYDEGPREERMWCIRSESSLLVQDLHQWLRTQWENMFGIQLTTSMAD